MSINSNDAEIVSTIIKQKRGRKPKNKLIDNIILEIKEPDENEDISVAPCKKRGRKPKGGKIIQQQFVSLNNNDTTSNVILHLKCSLKDLELNSLNNDVESYNYSATNMDLSYEVIENNEIEYNYEEDSNAFTSNNDSLSIKEVWKKLKQLEHNLHINNICDKKSACFWCTHDFENPPIYIPKHNIKETYHVYGCFCSPECAVAFLMNENIDSSTKFERYYLINHIYLKIYDYTKNIKPAPNPYYMLDKYHGNLSIQEFRSLFRNERLFFVVDKPLTRILPELHEDNDDFIINNKIIPSNTYQIKRKIQNRNQSKHTIVNQQFGISQNSII
jgi:hypothetical protein